MTYESRAYDTQEGRPVVVLVVSGHHDVSRLINTLSGMPAPVEMLKVGDRIANQVRRHNGGMAALKLLADHGGRDFTEETSVEAELKALHAFRRSVDRAVLSVTRDGVDPSAAICEISRHLEGLEDE